MKTKSGLLFILILMQVPPVCRAAQDDSQSVVDGHLHEGILKLESAYNSWNRAEFEAAIELFDRAASDKGNEALALYWKGTGLFFLSLYHLYSRGREPDEKQGMRTVKLGIETLSRSIQLDPEFSEAYALRGVLRGMQIEHNPWTAFRQGKKVASDRSRALELNPENPRVDYLTGVSLWNSPKILGSKDQAIDHLLEAEKGFILEKTKDLDRTTPQWGHSTCLSFIGDVYADQENFEKARDYYMKSLEVNANDPLAKRGLDFLKTEEKP